MLGYSPMKGHLIGKANQDNFKFSKEDTNKIIIWLKENVPEAASSCTNQGLSLAVSNGLRTLHEEGIVELISTMDAAKTGLFKLVGVSLNDFSEIIVKGA